MEKENIYMLKAIHMKENIKMGIGMVKVLIYIQMEIDMKAVGKKVKKMDLEFIIIKIKADMKGNLS